MSGIICLDKPQNMTSFACCSVFRRLLNIKKIGHAGTLDPMATGVLPLLVGRATRAMELLPVQDKRYTAKLRLGFTSDTQDIWGSVTATGRQLPSLNEIDAALKSFRGNIFQIPPMVSALKHNGKRLYDLARQGIEIDRAPRPVTVYSIVMLNYNKDCGEITFDCHCSKGTYIRTICADLGEKLCCGGIMTSLRRTMAAGFNLEQCITLDEARKLAESDKLYEHLITIDNAFSNYQGITVTEAQASRFKNGGPLSFNRLNKAVTDTVRVYSPDGTFIGLGAPENDELKILRLF